MVNYTILAAGFTTIFSLFTFVPPTAHSDGKGSLILEGTFPSGDNAGWIQHSLVDPSVIYAVNQDAPPGSVVSFTLSNSGVPTKVDETSSGGDGPTYVASFGKDGKNVLVVNYNGGSGRFIPTQPGSVAKFAPDNQTQLISFPPPAGGVSHPHFFNTFNDEVFVADLGADQIWRLSNFAPSTSPVPNYKITGSIPQPHLSGPRRFVTLPSPINSSESFIYTLHELSNSFIVQRVPESKESGIGGADGGVVPVLDSLITIAPGINPNDSDGGVWHAAELLYAETRMPLETLFYISNRNKANTSPNGDSIIIVSATFSPQSTSEGPKLKKIFTFDTGLYQIRGMELSPPIASSTSSTQSSTSDSESDESDIVGYLAAAGHFGGGVKILARTEGGRKLVTVAGFGLDGIQSEQPIGARNVSTFLWL